jgi:hypothetical protein
MAEMAEIRQKPKGSTPEGVTKNTDLFQYLLLIEQEI